MLGKEHVRWTDNNSHTQKRLQGTQRQEGNKTDQTGTIKKWYKQKYEWFIVR